MNISKCAGGTLEKKSAQEILGFVPVLFKFGS